MKKMNVSEAPSPAGGDHGRTGTGPESAAARAAPGLPRARREGAARAIRRRWSRKRLLWLGAGAVLLLLVLWSLRPVPVEVETSTVTRGALEVTVDADGTTRVTDHFVVAAPVSGQLERIALREGDPVQVGQVISRIVAAPLDPRAASETSARISQGEAMRQEAIARVAQTRAAFEQADRSAARVAVLQEAGAVSVETLELAMLDRETAQRENSAAESRLAAAEAELAAARRSASLSDAGGGAAAVSIVRAPVSGNVLRVHDASQRVVAPGAPLIDIARPDQLEVVVEVLSTDAVRIHPGAVIHIENWGGDRTLEARVRMVEPSAFTKLSALGVEEQRVRVVGNLLEQPAGLGDGYRVEAGIVTWSGADVLKVPTGALFRDGEAWATFVVEGGRSSVRHLEIGERGLDEAEVLSGLEEGDVVVLFPPDRLEDGTRVTGQ